MRLNRSYGFTLIELLACILLLGLVLSFSIYFVLNVYDNVKDKNERILKDSLLSAAFDYSLEFNNIWKYEYEKGNNTNKQYTCVSLRNLIDSGYINENRIKKNYSIDNTFIKLNKNDSLSFDGGEILVDNQIICNKDYDSSPPSIENSYEIFSDAIKVTSNCKDDESSISKYYFKIDNNNFISSDINEFTFTDNIKSSKMYNITTYCKNKSGILSKEITDSVTTNGIGNISIVANPGGFSKNKTVSISYINDNFYSSKGHYFSLTMNGESKENVYLCDNQNQCNILTKNIEPNKLYKTDINSINVTIYNNGVVYAYIKDNNFNNISDASYNVDMIDNTIPSVSISVSKISSDSVTVIGKCSDSESQIKSYEFSINNSNNKLINTSVDSYEYTFSNLSSGKYNINLVCTDNATNNSNLEVSATVEMPVSAISSNDYGLFVIGADNRLTYYSHTREKLKDYWSGTYITDNVKMAKETSSEFGTNIYSLKFDGTIMRSYYYSKKLSHYWVNLTKFNSREYIYFDFNTNHLGNSSSYAESDIIFYLIDKNYNLYYNESLLIASDIKKAIGDRYGVYALTNNNVLYYYFRDNKFVKSYKIAENVRDFDAEDIGSYIIFNNNVLKYCDRTGSCSGILRSDIKKLVVGFSNECFSETSYAPYLLMINIDNSVLSCPYSNGSLGSCYDVGSFTDAIDINRFRGEYQYSKSSGSNWSKTIYLIRATGGTMYVQNNSGVSAYYLGSGTRWIGIRDLGGIITSDVRK